MPTALEDQFHAAMLHIYESATRLNPPYRATRFLKMVHSIGGRATANKLLASTDVSAGFTELFLRGKENLKLSVEYLILQDPWRTLFTEDQHLVARERLIKVGITPPDAGI
ncbi:hypothetical protein ACVDHI_04575 [Aeromonas sp. 25-248]|jgi:hypothetical protein|uniref:hypothetical protein n=1 Tax=Aeromonas hydrophila TaxID=644 RepID=UPI00107E86A4|nr:hypothetical protein [Aeromonas hydrophila]QBX71445.1 hypothetical protein E4625_11775 [Aeromonas hydrophila]QBX76145.1 hypothetical protein E4630_11555 [Aeromonas hydrophila]